MKLRISLFTLALSTLSLIACGGGPGAGPVSEEDFRDGCQVGCEHEVECDPTSGETVETCVAECVADYGEVSGWLRGDAWATITDCLAGLACTADDDVCISRCEPTSSHNTWEAQCREVMAPCFTEPADVDQLCEVTPTASDTSDDVGFYCLFTPDVIERMTDCIPDGTTCQAGLTCIQGVFQSVGLGG